MVYSFTYLNEYVNGMKQCAKCKVEKSTNEFHKSKSGFQSYCKICNKETRRTYYANNSDRELKRNRSWELKKWEWYNSLKSKPCADCNITWPPYVNHWDHLPTFEKVDTVSNMMKAGRSRELILIEIAKCELVCGNCHSIRTHQRRQG